MNRILTALAIPGVAVNKLTIFHSRDLADIRMPAGNKSVQFILVHCHTPPSQFAAFIIRQ